MSKKLIKNKKALLKRMPLLKEWLNSAKKPDWVENVNKNNFSIKHNKGFNLAYDIENPKEKLQKQLKSIEFHIEDVTVVIGMGYGHLINVVLKNMKKEHVVLVVEPFSYFINEAFKKYDFSKYIDNGSLLFASPTETEISYLLAYIDSNKVVRAYTIFEELYTKYRIEEYQKLTIYTSDLINQMRCNTGTIIGAGAKIAENDITSVPYVVSHRGVKDLKDLYKDKPAILVSTGPSLSKNIHYLINKENREKYIIIAVAQALIVLLGYGIKPDFICTVDYGEINYEHFKNLMYTNIPLVCLNRTYAPIIKEWQGPKFIVASPNPGFENTVSGKMSEYKGWIEQGGSVAHMCAGLGILLGCNPITFIGQDLAWDGERSHIAQVDAGGKIEVDQNGNYIWSVDDPKSSLNDKDVVNGPSVAVPGYFGTIAKTNIGLASFITSFEAIIKGHPEITFYNSTQGGARIKGAKEITLQKYINDFCKKEIKNREEVVKPLLTKDPNGEKQVNEIIKIIKNDLDNLKKVIFNSSKALLANKNIIKAYQNKAEFKKQLASNEKYSNLANMHAARNPLVNASIYKQSREIASSKLKVKGNIKHLSKDIDDLRIRVKRNKLILKAAIKSSVYLKEKYEEVLRILEEYQETKDITLLTDEPKLDWSFEKADEFIKNKSFARLLVEVNEYKKLMNSDLSLEMYLVLLKTRALQIKADIIAEAIKNDNSEEEQKTLDYNYCIEESQKCGREQKDFKKALALLKKAKKIKPNEITARWGLATSLYLNNHVKESLQEYEELIKDFPDNLRFKFEYGQILLYENPEKALKVLIDVMQQTDEFDSFLCRIGDLHFQAGNIEKAIIAYKQYLEKFISDYEIWQKLLICYSMLNKIKEKKEAIKIAEKYKPNKGVK